MSVISILDLLFAISFGLLMHTYGGGIVDGTSLLDVHAIQGFGAVIITSITLVLISLRKGGLRMIFVLLSFLSIIGLAICLLSGWLIFGQVGVITVIARWFDFHGIQVVSTVVLTIIVLIFSIVRECGWEETQETAAAGCNKNRGALIRKNLLETS